ncbi:Aldehyde dehydrogenase family 3 member I1, chloroplastic [Psilocybe cubensis]|nr:Aldehyde dehydrogenase family 3 member I1, chloroplastic [Psilocybe cubensis]KAH9486012.1 Aldehyde dehydrogenase family 3 member I1, chloroplastic [Psilocybe cubensis]
MADYTPIPEILNIHNELRKTFRSGKTKPLEWRRHQLRQLARFAKENADALAECLRLDLGRPKQEAIMAEVAPIVNRPLAAAEKLEEWMGPEAVTLTAPWNKTFKTRVERPPKGVVLIISPWNYPIVLTLQPLYGAIAAGCCAALKTSEFTPHWSAFVAQNLSKYIDPSAYRVILGAVPEITKALELKWDHIFYTGNGRVARIIAAAAAKHLTPLTLELGGKSPVIVDSTADISISAKRILWGKINNSGQICVAPDYVLAEKAIVPQLIEAFKQHYRAFYPDGALNSNSFSRIVSDAHFERLKGLLKRTNGKIVFGGKWEEGEGKRGFEPTLVVDVKEGDALLEEELFGPILPLVAVENLDEAIEFLGDRDHPLTLYLFSNDEEAKKKVLANTTSGNFWINDTFQQVGIDDLPFGGVGESGYGRQIMRYSFENFIYERGVVDVPFEDEPSFAARYPPYTDESLAIFSSALQAEIPASKVPNGRL